MLEIELKFRLADPEAVRRQVVAWGGHLLAVRTEVDQYFNAPDRDFRATDEVFRIRCVDQSAVLTYKGPKLGGAVKTRPEIEVPLAVGAAHARDAERLVLGLGFRPTAVVRKRRELYALFRDGFELHLCFDDLEGIGMFLEVEIVAEESRLADAERAVQAVAAELGLTEPEPRAYLRMVLEAQGSDK